MTSRVGGPKTTTGGRGDRVEEDGTRVGIDRGRSRVVTVGTYEGRGTSEVWLGVVGVGVGTDGQIGVQKEPSRHGVDQN